MPARSLHDRQFQLKKGLDVALEGAPQQVVEPVVDGADVADVATVALLTADLPGRRLETLVEVGDRVRLGEPLLRSRERPELVVTSPGTGVVAEIERGRRRALRSVVVALGGGDDAVAFEAPRAQLSGLKPEAVRELLLASGLWTALRARPFGRIADPRAQPASLFVTAIDSNPLAADPKVVLAERGQAFRDGLEVLARLHAGPVFLCQRAGAALPGAELEGIRVAEFDGPHPAGLPGTHMHWLDPVDRGRTSWHVGYQDVAAIGELFTTGRLAVERVVALAGPRVRRPRLVRTRLGANVDDLVRGELESGPRRVISGSVLSGRRVSGWARHLGRFHVGVCVLAAEDTQLHGAPGPMLPVESFERVLPLELLPAPLLRALVIGDVEVAESLGCLELEEEDLALCTYVCPGKLDYGAHLRAVLDELAEEG